MPQFLSSVGKRRSKTLDSNVLHLGRVTFTTAVERSSR